MTLFPPEMLSAPSAVLFDIDGTLAVGTGDHMHVLAEEATATVGRPVTAQMVGERPHLNGVETSGWVDSQLARLALGMSVTADEVDAFLARYAARYRAALSVGTAAPGSAVPGAARALESLAAAGVVLGLSTGNAAEVAHAKLECFGIARWFDFHPEAGFGGRHPNRDAVASAAVACLGLPEPSQIWLVGDTAADMHAARVAGLRAVGVLTGAGSRAQLSAAGAHVVLDSLSDVAAFARIRP